MRIAQRQLSETGVISSTLHGRYFCSLFLGDISQFNTQKTELLVAALDTKPYQKNSNRDKMVFQFHFILLLELRIKRGFGLLEFQDF